MTVARAVVQTPEPIPDDTIRELDRLAREVNPTAIVTKDLRVCGFRVQALSESEYPKEARAEAAGVAAAIVQLAGLEAQIKTE